MAKVEGLGQPEDSPVTKSAAWLTTACAIVTKEPEYASTFSDPFAILFAEAISQGAAAELATFDDAAKRDAFISMREADRAGVVGIVLYRKPWFEKQTEAVLARGAGQLVILGAGCDTLSLRLAAKGLQPSTFELDRPEVIGFRNHVLDQVALDLQHVTRVGLDFQEQFFGDALIANGYRTDQQSVFVAEGVLEYLTDDEVGAIFDFVREKSGPGSTIVFSFTEPTAHKDYSGSSTGKSLPGEARTWEMAPTALDAFLRGRGFALVDMLTPEEAQARWLPKNGPAVHSVPFMHFAAAQVHPTA